MVPVAGTPAMAAVVRRARPLVRAVAVDMEAVVALKTMVGVIVVVMDALARRTGDFGSGSSAQRWTTVVDITL